jgi:hypothetical protein
MRVSVESSPKLARGDGVASAKIRPRGTDLFTGVHTETSAVIV